MAYSYQEIIPPGGVVSTVTVSIDFIKPGYLKFYADNTLIVPASVSGSQFTFSPALSGVGMLRVVRDTPINDVPNYFADTAMFTEDAVDENTRYMLHLAQEYSETQLSLTDVIFAPTSNPVHVPGRVFYDDATQSLAYYTDVPGTVMNIGFEVWVRVYNGTGATLVDGTAVYVNGVAGPDSLPSVSKASATSQTASDVIGVLTNTVPAGGVGYVCAFGSASNLDTSAWVPGTILYLSESPGALTPTVPALPANQISVAVVLVQDATGGKVLVRRPGAVGAPLPANQPSLKVVRFDSGSEDTYAELVATDGDVLLQAEKDGVSSALLRLYSGVRVALEGPAAWLCGVFKVTGSSATSEVPLYVDTVGERTTNAGVTVEGVLLKDSDVTIPTGRYLIHGNHATATNNWHSVAGTDGTLRGWNGNVGAGTLRWLYSSAGQLCLGDPTIPAADTFLHLRKTASGAVRGLVTNLATAASAQARWDLSSGTTNSYAISSITESGSGFSTYELACGLGVTGGMYFTSGTTTTPIVLRQGAVERFKVQTDGRATCNSPAGLGYGPGAGGTVTQTTSKTNPVTMNRPSGVVTMNNAALAQGTAVTFVCTNSSAAAGDTAIVNVSGGTGAVSQYIATGHCTAGEVVLTLRNMTNGSLAEAVQLTFAIIKGATS